MTETETEAETLRLAGVALGLAWRGIAAAVAVLAPHQWRAFHEPVGRRVPAGIRASDNAMRVVAVIVLSSHSVFWPAAAVSKCAGGPAVG